MLRIFVRIMGGCQAGVCSPLADILHILDMINITPARDGILFRVRVCLISFNVNPHLCGVGHFGNDIIHRSVWAYRYFIFGTTRFSDMCYYKLTSVNNQFVKNNCILNLCHGHRYPHGYVGNFWKRWHFDTNNVLELIISKQLDWELTTIWHWTYGQSMICV